MKRGLKGALALIFALALIITGCGAKSSPKELIEGSLGKSFDMKSYAFNTSIKLEDLQVDNGAAMDPNAQMVLNMMKNAELSVNGVVQQEPMKMEANLEISLKGDMEMKFSLPLTMDENKMWVKIPNIPMLAGQIPDELIGKTIEIDLKKMAEQSGQELPSAKDMKAMQNLSNDMFKAFLGKFDEKTYFSTVEKKDAGLPESVDAKQIVKFNVTNENLEQFITTFAKEALPALADVMGKEEYSKLLQIEKSEIEKMKQEMKADDSELKKGIEEAKKSLKINELSVTTAINKDQYPAYQVIVANLDVAGDDGVKSKIAARVTTELSKINEKVEFKPVPSDVLTMEQLQQMFGGY